MEVTPNEVTVLSGAYSALPVDPYATWVADHLTGHVLRCMKLANRLDRSSLAADWPSGDVVRPLVGRHRRWLLTVAGMGVREGVEISNVDVLSFFFILLNCIVYEIVHSYLLI